MYPAKPGTRRESDNWTWDALLNVAEACKKAEHDVRASGLAQTPNSVDTAGRLFRAFGAPLVDARATSRSARTRCARCWNMRRSS